MFPALLIIWFIFAGSFSMTNLIIGVIVCALITLLCSKFMGYSTGKFYGGLKNSGKILAYIIYLLKEIAVSNWAVLKIIWGREPAHPQLTRFHLPLYTDAAKVLVANSITLTPGTYTVGLQSNEFIVHALDESFTSGIEELGFAKKAKVIEGSGQWKKL